MKTETSPAREKKTPERRSRSASPEKRHRSKSPVKDAPAMPVEDPRQPRNPRNKKDDILANRTGGAYIPPAKLRAMQQAISDKSSIEYQRISWEALKKSIHGIVNKVNVSNITLIIRELFSENIMRGRGLLTRSILQAQGASPTFTNVFAGLVSIINTKFPTIGELILSRLVLVFRRSFRRNQKDLCLNACKFVAHLVNQQVCHEILALEILTLLLENPTDDSVEVAVGFIKEIGLKLSEVSSRALGAIFERMRNILHEASIDKRTQYMIEVLFAIRKDNFSEHPIVIEELDLVEEDDQFTHMVRLDGEYKEEMMLNVFKKDNEFLKNEKQYEDIKKEILGESDASDSDSSGSSSDSDSSDSSVGDSDAEARMAAKSTADPKGQTLIIDRTEINTVELRKTIYLTIQSSVDFEECCHKLMKLQIPEAMWKEMCHMIVDCCGQNRTYEKFFGLTATRLCLIKREYMELFELIFVESYETIHRLETNKLRNVAKFYAQLLYADAIPWSVMSTIAITEETTTSSSRIFIKILFQELSQYMGLPKLNTRLQEDTMAVFFEGLFPKDNPKNTRFAINFFTSIGLGGLTDNVRDFLKTGKVKGMDSSDESESSESSSSSSDSDSDSESEPEDIEAIFKKQQEPVIKEEPRRRSRSPQRRRRTPSKEDRRRRSPTPEKRRQRSASPARRKRSRSRSRDRQQSPKQERRSRQRSDSRDQKRKSRRGKDRSQSREKQRHPRRSTSASPKRRRRYASSSDEDRRRKPKRPNSKDIELKESRKEAEEMKERMRKRKHGSPDRKHERSTSHDERGRKRDRRRPRSVSYERRRSRS